MCASFVTSQNAQEPNAASLLTYHNICYQMRLCEQMHQAIITNEFEQFVGRFIRRRFPVGHIPQWVRDALLMAGISL